MSGIGFLFSVTGAIYGLAGMCLGIYMGIAHDFTLSPAHAHLNLVGFVTFSLMGLFYHLTPQFSAMLAKVQFGLSTVGVWTMIPGIALQVSGGDGLMLAVIGSLATVGGMMLFLLNIVLSFRRLFAGRVSRNLAGMNPAR